MHRKIPDLYNSNFIFGLNILSIPSGKVSQDLPYLYRIPKLHKTPYKERYIAGSSTCSTKELSIHLTKILSAVNKGNNKITELRTILQRESQNS
jgi:hypothetical protein